MLLRNLNTDQRTEEGISSQVVQKDKIKVLSLPAIVEHRNMCWINILIKLKDEE